VDESVQTIALARRCRGQRRSAGVARDTLKTQRRSSSCNQRRCFIARYNPRATTRCKWR